MRNNFAQQQNKRTKRSTVQTDFDPRQTLPSSAPLKKQSTTTNSGIYRNGLANTARNGSQTGTNFDPRQALPSTAAQKQQSVSANRSSYRSGLANAARNGSQTGTNFNTRQVLPPAAERQNVNANRSSYRSGVANAARAMAKRSETDFDPMQVLAPTAVEKRQHQNNYYTESYRGRLKNAALQTERPNEKFFDPASVLPSPAPEKRWDINVHDILYHDALERAARDGHWQSPTGRRSAEESADRPSFGKLAFDSFASGAGYVNRGVANVLGLAADGLKGIERMLQAAGIRKTADNMDLSGYDAALANAGEQQSQNLIYSDLLADSFPNATIRPQTGSYQSADFSGRTQTVGLDIPLDEAVRKENLTNLLWNEIEASVKGKVWSDLMNRIPHGDFQRLQQYPELRKAYQNAKYKAIKSTHQRIQKLTTGGVGARVNYQLEQDLLKFYP